MKTLEMYGFTIAVLVVPNVKYIQLTFKIKSTCDLTTL